MRVATFVASFTTFGMVMSLEQCLYPRESETREVKSLDGLWNFVKSKESYPLQGVKEKWFLHDLSASHPTIPMPVPASYNDITVERELRDHVGTVWYDRRFFVPKSWASDRVVWIRFGSVHYAAQVWINGLLVVTHEIGHLPFQKDITDALVFGQENRVTVLCDNTLLQSTIPQGKVVQLQIGDNKTQLDQTYTFDFFNYAGIHRSVQLFTTPKVHISGVHVRTNVKVETNESITGIVKFVVHASNTHNDSIFAEIQIRDKSDQLVASTVGVLNGSIAVPNANLWWPYLMHTSPGYLYTFEIILKSKDEGVLDIYRLKIGIRSIKWDNTKFLINDKPVYFRGFGRHEDSDIRGKGLDLAQLTRDFNLMKWIGANAYRTSHYPYSEESMMFADEQGIMVIDECPSVDTDNFTPVLLSKHKESLHQLILRDRNHPSVMMWSIANEPRVGTAAADTYFGEVANYTRGLDPHRPVTAAIATPLGNEKVGKHMDVISFNRYNGWYANAGKLETITEAVVREATAWNKKYDKPIIMMEFGADTLEGLHFLPSFVWSEEYQLQLLSRHFKAFDSLREAGFFIGEFVWNFADFKTNQAYTRVGGNKKGVFTRQRQPKEAAHFMRRRYFALAESLDGCPVPDDLQEYIYAYDPKTQIV